MTQYSVPMPSNHRSRQKENSIHVPTCVQNGIGASDWTQPTKHRFYDNSLSFFHTGPARGSPLGEPVTRVTYIEVHGKSTLQQYSA